MELENKIIIIIGVSSGIGKVVVLFFVWEGVYLFLGVCRSYELEVIIIEIKVNGGCVMFFVGDVIDEVYLFVLVEWVIVEFGWLDGVFNNVGIMGESCVIFDMMMENWYCVIEINLSSVFFVVKV